MKKDLNTEKLFEALGEIDNNLLQEAFFASDRQKLDQLKNKKNPKIIFFHPIFKRVIAACVCITVVATAFFAAEKLNIYSFFNTNNSVTADSNKNSHQNEVGASGNSAAYDSSDYDSTSDDNYSNGDTKNNFTISNLDMLNFYSAKKVISDNSLLPTSGKEKAMVKPLSLSNDKKVLNLSDSKIYYYEINRYTEFTITMVTYFKINLNDENGFLAQKLGGAGLVEVVVTQNSLEPMITFKKGDKYFSCLKNGASWNQDSTNSLKNMRLSTHKYIEGFNIVKNFEQENYQFTVHFENSKVTGIDCERFKDEAMHHQTFPDDITLIDDFCVVLFTSQTFTIDQLEGFYSGQEQTEGTYEEQEDEIPEEQPSESSEEQPVEENEEETIVSSEQSTEDSSYETPTDEYISSS